MMLRSSSTPLLGSLLSSFTDSPNTNNHHHHSEFHGSPHRHTPKILCTNGGSPSLGKSLFHSPSVTDLKGKSSLRGITRVQSEGNLQELVDFDEFSLSKKLSRKSNNCCSLETIPSFSLHNYDAEDIEEDEGPEMGNPFRIGNLVLKQDRIVQDKGKMYLARGISYTDVGGGSHSGGSYRTVGFGGDSSMEEHYKMMLEGDPANPLILRNYAHFLYQKKGDLERAEEYYSRAILADPNEGEVLSQYAQLIWELYHDKVRAENYFERATKASSENSHIQAAYASFLWDAEDEEEEQGNATGNNLMHHGLMASATTA